MNILGAKLLKNQNNLGWKGEGEDGRKGKGGGGEIFYSEGGMLRHIKTVICSVNYSKIFQGRGTKI